LTRERKKQAPDAAPALARGRCWRNGSFHTGLIGLHV